MSPAVHGRSMRPKSWSGMRCCQQLHKVRVFAGKVGWFQVGGDRYIDVYWYSIARPRKCWNG